MFTVAAFYEFTPFPDPAALREALPERRIYLGNRNWRPFLSGTLEEMANDGVRRAIAETKGDGSYAEMEQLEL